MKNRLFQILFERDWTEMPKFAKGHEAFRNKGALKVEKLFIY